MFSRFYITQIYNHYVLTYAFKYNKNSRDLNDYNCMHEIGAYVHTYTQILSIHFQGFYNQHIWMVFNISY